MRALGWQETKDILKRYNIPYAKTGLVKTKKEAISLASKIGYPLVLKISSFDIIHKTEINAVQTNIVDKDDIIRAWDKIMSQPYFKKSKPRIEGFLIQRQVSGEEIVIGMKRDSQFGPVIMFGLGGVFVEVLEDVSFRVVPVSNSEAKKMMREIKGFQILNGFRNQKPVNLKKIEKIITNLSDLCSKETKIEQVDLNPIIVNNKQALVVDARIIYGA